MKYFPLDIYLFKVNSKDELNVHEHYSSAFMIDIEQTFAHRLIMKNKIFATKDIFSALSS